MALPLARLKKGFAQGSLTFSLFEPLRVRP